MKKVLVTGGCGYIGSHTVVELLERGFDVISIDNFSNSDPIIVEKISAITNKNFVNYNIDLKNQSHLKFVFEKNKIDYIIHFAAFKSVPQSVKNPLDYYENNLVGLINLLNISSLYNIEKFIFSSSCSVYGTPLDVPVFEKSSVNPESPYARTKYFSEEIIKDLSKISKTKFINLRYFNPIGAHKSLKIGEDSKSINVLSRIIATYHGSQDSLMIFGNDWPTKDGTCIRDYIHVSDVADAHISSIVNNIDENFININVGTGKGITVLELIKIFENISGKRLNYEIVERRPGDVSEIWADVSFSGKVLNWKSSRSIEESVLSHFLFSKNF